MIVSRDARTGAYWRVLARTRAYSRFLTLACAFSRLLALTHMRLHSLAKDGAYLCPQGRKDELQTQLCCAEKR
jgi:hypothetical protein